MKTRVKKFEKIAIFSIKMRFFTCKAISHVL